MGKTMDRISAGMPIGLAMSAAAALVLAVGEAPAKEAAQTNPDLAFALSVDIGRLDTMIGKAEEVVEAVAGGDALPNTADTKDESDATLRELKLVVLRFNIVVESACRTDQLRAQFCRPLYVPNWLNDAPGTRYDQVRLQAMVKDTSSRIMPFWNAICARGKIVIGDARFCELE
jgi:hypothetical protein